jgi:hypothetical protein
MMGWQLGFCKVLLCLADGGAKSISSDGTQRQLVTGLAAPAAAVGTVLLLAIAVPEYFLLHR